MPKQGGATTLFALPTEFIWLMKARTPVGVSWGVQKGSMAMIRAAQLADVACVLPAVAPLSPANRALPPLSKDAPWQATLRRLPVALGVLAGLVAGNWGPLALRAVYRRRLGLSALDVPRMVL